MPASPEPPPLGMAKKFVFACLPALVLLLGAELAVRLSGAAEQCPTFQNSTLWACDPILYFKINPKLVVHGTPLNRAGFRSREFTPKPPGVFRILALGDSCTFGITALDQGFYLKEPYPQRLERLANEHREPGKLEVMNAGVPGYTSFHGVMLLRTRLRTLAPDLVTVRFGWNDHLTPQAAMANAFREPQTAFARRLEDVALRTELYPFSKRLGMELREWLDGPHASAPPKLPTQWTPTVPLDEYKHNLRRIVEIAHGRGANVWLLTSPDALLTPADLARYEALPADANARTMLNLNAIPSFARLSEVHQTYNAATREVGAELSVRVVDMDALYRTHAAPELFSIMDPLHPTQQGNDLEAQALYDELRNQGIVPRD